MKSEELEISVEEFSNLPLLDLTSEPVNVYMFTEELLIDQIKEDFKQRLRDLCNALREAL